MAANFAFALDQTLNELEMTQLAFANAVGLSHSMITKLLAGEEAHRKSYAKIFSYFRGRVEDKQCGRRLMDAYIRDVVRDIDLQDDYDAAGLEVSTTRDAAVSHLFRRLSPSILLACNAVGVAAEKSNSVYNALMSLAELAREVGPQSGGDFPKEWFSAGLRKPTKPQRLLGGSLGDLIIKLQRSDDV